MNTSYKLATDRMEALLGCPCAVSEDHANPNWLRVRFYPPSRYGYLHRYYDFVICAERPSLRTVIEYLLEFITRVDVNQSLVANYLSNHSALGSWARSWLGTVLTYGLQRAISRCGPDVLPCEGQPFIAADAHAAHVTPDPQFVTDYLAANVERSGGAAERLPAGVSRDMKMVNVQDTCVDLSEPAAAPDAPRYYPGGGRPLIAYTRAVPKTRYPATPPATEEPAAADRAGGASRADELGNLLHRVKTAEKERDEVLVENARLRRDRERLEKQLKVGKK